MNLMEINIGKDMMNLIDLIKLYYILGTYMTNHQSVNAKPVGLTIDNGNIVNGLLQTWMD